MAERFLKQEGLPASTPRYQYRTKMRCLKDIEYVASHTRHSHIILEGVDPRKFHQFSQKGPLAQLLKSCLFPCGLIILNITIQTPVHATVQAGFISLIDSWSRNQTEDIDQSTGSMVRQNSRGKRPDGAWGPTRIERYWPSVVVEIGWMEGPTKLRKDIEFWLGSETRAAISLNITATGRMTLDAWTKNENGEVESHQRLQVRPRGSPVGDFTIPFDAFYLREKRETETDFVFTHQMFARLAEKVQRRIRSLQHANAAMKTGTDKPHPSSGQPRGETP
ncbi:hypothetical protein N7454_001581 [Penicillium verhagenii]|nr:hypothetical protein N7454_001581 [Penicillium verhagenii]